MRKYTTYILLSIIVAVAVWLMVCSADMALRVTACVMAVIGWCVLLYKIVMAYKANDKSEKLERGRGIIFALGVGAAVFASIFYWSHDYRMKKEDAILERGVVANGVVTDIKSTNWRFTHAYYTFSLGGSKYDGMDLYSMYWKGIVGIGDTVLIVCDSLNPDISRLYRDENKMPVRIENGRERHSRHPHPKTLWYDWLVIILLALVVFAVPMNSKKGSDK